MEVKSNSEGSDLVDPFDVDEEYRPSLLAFFPTTVKYSSSSLLPNRDSSNFDFLPDHFKARVFSNCDNWLKQGKAILEGSVDQLEFGKTAAVSMENEKVTRGKRPALGIQRAKFSLKPMPSQPAVGMDFNIDIDKLSDPEEFFAAFDRMENAKKEVRRLRGEPLLDLDQNRPSLAPRQRRPSILGRTTTYKHRPHSLISEANINETSLPSQVTFDNDILSPTRNNNVPDDSVMDESPSMRVTDSKSTTTRKVSKLDELLSSNFEGLDEDGVQKLLQDKLQIKPVDIGKTFLPNWRVQLPTSLISTSSLSNDTVFCPSGASKAVRNRDPRPPTKSKSPLASISLLNRNIAKLSPSRDPFSILNIDLSPTEATDPAREPEKRVDQGEQSDEVDARNNLSESRRSPAHGVENIAVSRENSFVSVVNDVDPVSEPIEKENVVGEFNQLDMMDLPEFGRSPENEENITVSGERSLDLISKDVGPTSESEMQEDEVAAARLSARHRLSFEILDMNTSSAGVENGRTNEQSDTENISVEELSKGLDGSSKGKRKEKEKSMAPSEAVVSKETVKKGRLTKISQRDAPGSGGTRSKRRNVEGAQPGRSKGELRRFSLYNAGTKWEAGVRRSTRIRMKPLQYWKGERFLYGRVNQSLVTVIGVKYACPSEDKKEKFQVKSFVSDEHKDLVESASFY